MMRRRTTLGPIGSRGNRASLTSKPSGRKSVSGMPPKRRESYHPSATTGRRRSSVASRRRSSVYGAGSGSTKMTDTRPLKDKAYQKSCIRMVIEFLMERGYDHPISPHILTRPTARDFHAIVEFLFKRIDPHFKFKGRIEDELPRKFKGLKYPFAISKTALQAVGAPHTWPPLLGALVWLIELLKYDESSSKKEEDDFEDDVAKLFYSYLSDAYGHYMAGDDERATQLDEELAASFAERNTQLQKMRDEKLAEKAELEAKIVAMESKENTVEALSELRENFKADKAKFEGYVDKLERRQAELNRRLEGHQGECEASEAKLAELRRTIQRLEVRLENQELSAADVEHMGKEKRLLKESAERVAAQREASQSALWEMEMQVTKEMEELNIKIQAYHDAATALHLLPATAKYADGVDYEIRVSAMAGKDGSDLLSTDIASDLSRELKKLKQRFTNQRFAALTKCDDLNDEVSDKREATRAAEKVIADLETKLARLDEGHKTEKVETDRSLAAMRDEMADVEAEISHVSQVITDEAAAAADLDKAALDKLEADFLEAATRLQAKRQNVRKQIAQALEYLTDHKTRVQAQLERAATSLTARRDTARAEASQ